MKNNKKRNTWGFSQAYDYTWIIKKRRNTTKIIKDQKTQAAFEVIEHLLSKVYEDEKQKQLIMALILTNMQRIEEYDNRYWMLQCEQHMNVIIHAEQEPKQLQVQVIKAIKLPERVRKVSNLNGSLNKQAVQKSSTNKTNTNIDADKFQRENIAQKYRRQYSTIMNTNYTSQTMPISQYWNRYTDDIDMDIDMLRKIKAKIKNTIHSKQSKNQEQISNNDSNTKPVELDDLTNYMPCSSFSKNPSKRNSKDFRQNFSLYESMVTAKESKVTEIKTKQIQQESHRYVQLKYPAQETRIFNSLSCSSRQQIKQKLQKSFHAKHHPKYIQDKLMKNKTKNSISTSFLPKISKL